MTADGSGSSGSSGAESASFGGGSFSVTYGAVNGGVGRVKQKAKYRRAKQQTRQPQQAARHGEERVENQG